MDFELPFDIEKINKKYIEMDGEENVKAFFNPYNVLSLVDSDGLTPQFYVNVSNRTGGKTFGWTSWLGLIYFMHYGKIALITRHKDDLGVIATGVLSASFAAFWPEYAISEKKQGSIYSEIHLTKKEIVIDDKDKEVEETEDFIIGYVIPINSASKLKYVSSVFKDVVIMFMDEFQTLDNRYIKNEVSLLKDIIITVSRGSFGSYGRFVPCVLCSNAISQDNPYYYELGLSARVDNYTKNTKLPGIVFNRFFNKGVDKARNESPLARAFGNTNRTIDVAGSDGGYLLDSNVCIASPDRTWGKSHYMATLVDGSEMYACRIYDNGYMLISHKIDSSCKNIWAISVDGMENIELIRNSNLCGQIRDYYYTGLLRFSDIHVKNVIVSKIL